MDVQSTAPTASRTNSMDASFAYCRRQYLYGGLPKTDHGRSQWRIQGATINLQLGLLDGPGTKASLTGDVAVLEGGLRLVPEIHGRSHLTTVSFGRVVVPQLHFLKRQLAGIVEEKEAVEVVAFKDGTLFGRRRSTNGQVLFGPQYDCLF